LLEDYQPSQPTAAAGSDTSRALMWRCPASCSAIRAGPHPSVGSMCLRGFDRERWEIQPLFQLAPRTFFTFEECNYYDAFVLII
jgi:hypothetical protein